MADLLTELAIGDVPSAEDLGFGLDVSDAALTSARSCGDPLAGEVVAELASRRDFGPRADVLDDVRVLAETEGGVFRELIESCCYVPAWADFAAMDAALRLGTVTGALAALALTRSPTPVRDATTDAAAQPGRESAHAARSFAERVRSTGFGLLLVPRRGDVQPGGRHHSTATRVRLMHATMRRHLTESGHRDLNAEAPIGQDHLAVALTSIAYLNMAGAVRMGVDISDSDVAATGLLWRWIAHVLGVEDRLVRLDDSARVARFRRLLEHVPDQDVLPPGGSPLWGLRGAVRAVESAYGMVLRLPGAEAVLNSVGSILLDARYRNAE